MLIQGSTALSISVHSRKIITLEIEGGRKTFASCNWQTVDLDDKVKTLADILKIRTGTLEVFSGFSSETIPGQMPTLVPVLFLLCSFRYCLALNVSHNGHRRISV